MTCDKENEAKRIVDGLLGNKLAACVSVYPKGNSHYWWKGKIEKAREFLLIAKTTRSLLDGLVREVKRLHGYEVPEIVAIPIACGSGDYLAWLDETLKPEGDNARKD